MPKRIWKNLDEFYGDDSVEQLRRHEFEPSVNDAIRDLRNVKGLDQEQSAEAVAAEAAPLLENTPTTGLSRRGFLQLTGAASVFAMTSCWHNPPSTLVSYHTRPEGHVLGRPNYFSTVISPDGKPRAVMVKTYDFRPIKLEGNPDYQAGKGTLDLQGQADLLNLYDPDRAVDGPGKVEGFGEFTEASWNDLDDAVAEAIKTGTVGLILPPITGPSQKKFLDEFKAAVGDRLQVAVHDPLSSDSQTEVRQALLGRNGWGDTPTYALDKADVIVSLGSDLIGGGETTHIDQVAFGDQRRLHKDDHGKVTMGSFIAFEPMMSQGGSCADLRVRVPMECMANVAWAIAEKLAETEGFELPAFAAEAAKALPAEYRQSTTLGQVEGDPYKGDAIAFVAEKLHEIKAAGKASLIYAGGATHRGPASAPLHAAVTFLNMVLGNEGRTVNGRWSAIPASGVPSNNAVQALLEECAKGSIETLIVVGSNPLYAFPQYAGSKFDDAKPGALSKVKTVLAINDRLDETAAEATWFAPITHDLESWGDAELRRGEYALQQPVIHPLWNSRQWQESLMSIAVQAGLAPDTWSVEKPAEPIGRNSAASRQLLWVAENNGIRSWQSYVAAVWQTEVFKNVNPAVTAEEFYRGALGTGLVTVPVAMTMDMPALNTEALAQFAPAAPNADGMRLVINRSRTLGDGRHANNAWLQETPDAISKVTWDNYLAMSITDAKKVGVGKDSVVKVTPEGGEAVYLPVMIQPGMAEGTVETFFGWGRSYDRAGVVAEGGGIDEKQVNGFTLTKGLDAWGIPVSVELTGERYTLASTQYHQYMDGRNIALDDVLELHQEDPDLGKRLPSHALWHESHNDTDVTAEPNDLSLFDSSIVYPGRRWGMSVDLNACTGCNACLVACNAENNVPVVGRDEVRLGREMHWIRIDRFYSAGSITPKERKKRTRRDSKVILEGDKYSEEADPDDVEVFHMPMMCQQCGHAPCEEVCPAMATMHNDEGINVQVYNRCIGTRYCANNCPYKVRRFNFYEYGKYRFGPQGSGDPLGRVMRNFIHEGQTSSSEEMLVAPLEMMLNPAVTVRSKGVMEKCNFCLQRQREIREEEKRTNRKYEDGSITTACAQTCPTRAIMFGDINDENSLVRQHIDSVKHDYRVLGPELSMHPSVSYLRKVRNRPATADEAAPLLAKKGGHGSHDDHGEHDDHSHGEKEGAH